MCNNLILLANIYFSLFFYVKLNDTSKEANGLFNSDVPDDLGKMKNPGLQEFDEDDQFKIVFCSNYCPNHTMCIHRRVHIFFMIIIIMNIYTKARTVKIQ